MIFTWVHYGKPDVSMCLNASLAGLVGITAGCDVLDCTGAIIVGVVSGLIVNFGVWFLDNKLHVDDPVGAVAVHFLNGIWGTLAVGLLATGTTPDYPEGMLTGLFYGGGFELLGLQLLGVLSVCAWTAVTITLAFLLIKAIFGLREPRGRNRGSGHHGARSCVWLCGLHARDLSADVGGSCADRCGRNAEGLGG